MVFGLAIYESLDSDVQCVQFGHLLDGPHAALAVQTHDGATVALGAQSHGGVLQPLLDVVGFAGAGGVTD